MSNVRQIHIKRSAVPGRIYKENNILYIGETDGTLRVEEPISGDIKGTTLRTKINKIGKYSINELESLLGMIKKVMYVVEIDFGETSVNSKKITVENTNVTATSKIIASIAYEKPEDKDLDEVILESFKIICGQPIAGSFQLLISTIDGSTTSGKFKVNYLIS